MQLLVSQIKDRQLAYPLDGKQSGFTLIEILVVLVLLGLVSGVMLGGLGGASPQRKMQNEVLKVQQLIEQVRDEALLNNEEWGIVFELSDSEQQTYRFLRYDEKAREWLDDGSSRFRKRAVPGWLLAELYLDSNEQETLRVTDEDKVKPQILLLSSGETTPFTLHVSLLDDQTSAFDIKADGINESIMQPADGRDL